MARKVKQPINASPGAAPRLNASWVRHPIRMFLGVALRVLIYARYSTDEQNPRSIDAQVAYCRRFLEALIDALAPAVVMLDEVEKAFSGVSASGQTDSGVSARLFGSFRSR